MIVLGIDPGLSGACAVIDHNGLRAVFDLPTMPIPGVGPKALIQNKIDGRSLRSLLLKHVPPGEVVGHAVIEQVGTMGGKNNSVQSQGSLLRTLGAIETVAECLKFPVEYVASTKWKRFYGLIDPNLKDSQRKAASLRKARVLYPACQDIPLAGDHNRAEAILIAHWGHRRLS